MAQIYQVPLNNNLQYTLNTQLPQGGTTMTLSATVAGVVQAPGVCVVDRVDASGNKTAPVREYISFTGVSGNQLTGLTKGLAGSTDQVHNVGAIVEFVPDVTQEIAWYNVLTTEHTVGGNHGSLPSTSYLRTYNLAVPSQASIYQENVTISNLLQLAVPSLASIQQLFITNTLNASGASIQGVFPSGASGQVLTSNGPANIPVWAPGSGTGGFNGLFQVPGGLASYVNIGGLIPVPVGFTAQFMEAYVQTPASVASVSILVKKNLNTAIGVVAIPAGGTYGSSASFSNTALVGTDNLTIDINSNASLAADLSLLVRAL